MKNVELGMKRKRLLQVVNFCCLVLILIFSGCQNVLDITDEQNDLENGFVRIYIGENNSSLRTLQPDRNAIEGYRLTFSGPSTVTPVIISEGNSVDVYLANGNWRITAIAYKLGGTIGNSSDSIASGFINISLSGGVVTSTVFPIILSQYDGIGNGFLNYSIMIDSGISGYMKLSRINNISVNSFGEDGKLTLSDSVDEEITLASGRYIAEVRLVNEEENIAFYREVIEIWAGTITNLVFSPTVFFDPNMELPTVIMEYGDLNIATTNIILPDYSNGIITITSNGTYTISMKDGVESTITEMIVIASGVTADITISNLNINLSDTMEVCAFNMTGATVNLTLIGENVLRSGWGRAGLQVPTDSSLTITTLSTGSLTAIGGAYGAGIGGGIYGSGGTISISGGIITATGGMDSSGIGGGGYGSGGTIDITGGTVTATGDSRGVGIGGGINGSGGTINNISNAVIFTMGRIGIQPELPSGENLRFAIIFNNINGTMYDNVTLDRNVVIPSGMILGIANGQTLTIQSGFTFTNNGTIIKHDNGNIIGTIAGNQPIEPAFTISGSSSYTYTSGFLTITGSGNYTIGMRTGITSTTAERIIISSGVNANVILSDVNIDMRNNHLACAFDMTGATVNLILVGENVLRSSADRAGLEAPAGSSLHISTVSTGSLTATGGRYGAGIGGGIYGSGGIISISSGTISAQGGNWGAGIGGGYLGSSEAISISGGTIYASSIGGGHDGLSEGNISITGGTIATSIHRGTITAINGNAIIIGTITESTLPSNENIGPAIIFNSDFSRLNIYYGIMYGNVTLSRNVTIPQYCMLNITNGQTFTIESGFTLTNNGAIINEGGIIIGAITGNQPKEPAFTVSGSSAYTYKGGTLTITGNGSYSIGMKSGITSTAFERIEVASGVNADITLSNVNIDAFGYYMGLFNVTNSIVNLTLIGDNVFSAAAILSVYDNATLCITEASTGTLTVNAIGISEGSTINISGGTVIANGHDSAAIYNDAAIYSDGGTINISGGTVTANLGIISSGVINISGGILTATNWRSNGTGLHNEGGIINITGGTVIAFGGNVGVGCYSGGIINNISGNAVVSASSIQAELPTGANLGPAILFIGYNGTMYGNVTFPERSVLPISAGQSLTIPSDVTLTNNGTINNSGMINRFGVITGSGSITGNQPVP